MVDFNKFTTYKLTVVKSLMDHWQTDHSGTIVIVDSGPRCLNEDEAKEVSTDFKQVVFCK